MDELVTQIERETIQLIDRIEGATNAALSSISAIAEQVATVTPALQKGPFAELIPSPAESVRSFYTVAEHGLAVSRRISEGFVDAIAPVTSALMPWMKGASTKRARKGSTATEREAA